MAPPVIGLTGAFVVESVVAKMLSVDEWVCFLYKIASKAASFGVVLSQWRRSEINPNKSVIRTCRCIINCGTLCGIQVPFNFI